MAYQRKPGDFSLNKNDKGDNPKRPDYRGEGLDLSGQPIELSVWVKDGPKGEWFSGVIKPRQERKAKEEPAEPKKGGSSRVGSADLEDDIPF